MSELEEFWDIDQTLLDKESIKEKCRQYYTEDFINNYDHWKGKLTIMNENIQSGLSGVIPGDKFTPIGFDHFCKRFLELCDGHIDKNGNIGRDYIVPLCRVLLQEHCSALL